jgi:ribose-phosphate pyrophosphokinase
MSHLATYTLPEMKQIEHSLLRLISGGSRILADWTSFPSGEIFVHVLGVEPKVCVLGRTTPPAENIVRTIMLMDTLHRSGATDITLLVPYLAYSRQDRPRQAGDPNSAACMTRMFAGMGADRLVTLDLHSDRAIESSHVLVQNVSLMPEMATVLGSALPSREKDFIVVSPDRGGQQRAELFAASTGRKPRVLWIEKERSAGRVVGKRIIGRIETETAVIVDDILDSGSTVAESVRLLREKGVKNLYLCAIHPVMTGKSAQILREAGFKRILLSDTLPIPAELQRMKEVKVISAARILAEAVLGKQVEA